MVLGGSLDTGQGFIQDLVWGGNLKTFGIYVMGVHKQAPSKGVWGHSSPSSSNLSIRL